MNRRHRLIPIAALAAAALIAAPARGVERFPTPEFESGYELPVEQLVAPVPEWWHAMDVALFAAAMVAVAAFLHVLRSRLAVGLTAVAAVLYFGFWRMGCICPVGSVCNVARGICVAGPPVPWTVIGLFAVPLAAALLVGRVFCGGVCPLGAIQDVVLLRPVRVPRWLDEPLGLFRWFYLAAAIVLVYGSGRFLVCQFDPFVGFFRMNAPLLMFVIGGAVLVLAAFVGRPYCRYVCPYGALLGVCSRFSVKRVTVTPRECIKCGLCADACPFGAIRMYEEPATSVKPAPQIGTAAGLLALTVVLGFAGARAGQVAATPWADGSYAVRVSRQVWAELQNPALPKTLESEAFAATGLSEVALFDAAKQTVDRFEDAGLVAGAFLGVVIGLKLFSLSRRRPPEVVQVDAAKCLSCGRCYSSCPIHRRKQQGRLKP